MASVLAVCLSEKKGTPKHPVSFVCLHSDYGIEGDAHAGNWHRQVSLLAEESVNRMREKVPDLPVGAFGENILTEGIVLTNLSIGTVLSVGETLLQVTQIGKECHSHCEIYKVMGDCIMPREGVFAKVLSGGTIHKGDIMTIVSEKPSIQDV